MVRLTALVWWAAAYMRALKVVKPNAAMATM